MARYQVFHSPMDVQEYYEDQLEPLEAVESSDRLVEALRRGEGVPPAEFRCRLTAARLAHPLTDNLYVLQAARIRFVPFQFKPLLRLLRSDRPRLLIADEVGVGKTIEAGLIMRELQSRQPLGNVLVVCPKALVTKWRAEMRRFEEDFRPLDGPCLQYCLREAHLEGWPPEYSRAIMPLELLRRREYLLGNDRRRDSKGLVELDPPPRFDLVVVDEAHHLRNPTTLSHAAARFLCDVAEVVLFLSATPVHTGSRNLFTLLNLLRPDLLPDEEVFKDLMEPTRWLLQALRTVRAARPEEAWQSEAAEALRSAGKSRWGRSVLQRGDSYAYWLNRLESPEPLSRRERVECLRELEEMLPTSELVSRTRRRDIGAFTVREPRTVRVPFLPAQEEFYRRLIDLRRRWLSTRHDSVVVRLILDTLERQAASCLPALAESVEGFLETGRFSTQTVSDAWDEEVEDNPPLPAFLQQEAEELRQAAQDLPVEDPKLDKLQGIVAQTLADDGPGKVLVFSFFLHTLDYLHRRLREAGVRVGRVDGRTDELERERLRERFRLPRSHPAALDVLLSSEVGCEGLDYEFCDRLVNYDIPWNPMRIEQRIGRIDRFGQKAEKVLIFNFVTPGTVEERIFFRCYERLGIFQQTLGDLEEVLGEIVDGLSRLSLDTRLTPRQAEEKARQLADSALLKIEETRRLEAESGSLLGLEPGFTDEVDRLVREGRFVSSEELEALVSRFVERNGGSLAPVQGRPGIHCLRLPQGTLQAFRQQAREFQSSDRAVRRFQRWLEGGERELELTFDQERAVEDRQLPFVTPLHPLARMAVRYWQSASDPLVSRLQARATEGLPPGDYLYLCELWESVGVRPEVRLVTAAWSLGEGRASPELEDRLLALLKDAGQEPPAPELPDEAVAGLEHRIRELREGAVEDLRRRNRSTVDRQLASLESFYEHRLRRIAEDLDRVSEERIRRMKESERARVEEEYRRRKAELESRREGDIVTRRIAMGTLRLENPQDV